ncbi:uncharacterized protein LOC144159556 [Haemaphysalis longicornis]
MNRLFAIAALLCLASVVVDGQVDAVLDSLKAMVRQLVPNEAMAKEFTDKIDSARECLDIAKDINPAVIKRFTDGIIPTVTECATQTMGVSGRAEKEAALKACFKDRADKFKASSGMTPDEMDMFDRAGQCIQEKAQV